MTTTHTRPAEGQASGVVSRIEGSGLLGKRALLALGVALFFMCALAAVWVSALQAQVPRNMPFGVTGNSSVVTAAESRKISGYQVSFVNTTYPSESAAINAINEGKIYGAYITGTSSDTLLSSQAKRFFAYTEVVPLFAQTAAKLGRPLQVKIVKPLPAGKDPVGAVTGLLLLRAVVEDGGGDPDLHADGPGGAALAGVDPAGLLGAQRGADRQRGVAV
ncbi:MAG: hypothetical protein WBP81_17060 [Solirubrobacteraceae bacterium]